MDDLQKALDEYYSHFGARGAIVFWNRGDLRGTDEYLIGRIRKAIEIDRPIRKSDRYFYSFEWKKHPDRIY